MGCGHNKSVRHTWNVDILKGAALARNESYKISWY